MIPSAAKKGAGWKPALRSRARCIVPLQAAAGAGWAATGGNGEWRAVAGRRVTSGEWGEARGFHRANTARWGRVSRCARNDGFWMMREFADGGVGVEDGRGELAGSEGVEGAETGVEFGGGDAAFAVEPAEEMGGGTLSFERIAFEAGGNQVAIGVAPGPGAGHDVVEALDARVGAAQTIETMAAFAEVDGLAQGAGLEEIEAFEVEGLRLAGGAADGDGARPGGQAP